MQKKSRFTVGHFLSVLVIAVVLFFSSVVHGGQQLSINYVVLEMTTITYPADVTQLEKLIAKAEADEDEVLDIYYASNELSEYASHKTISPDVVYLVKCDRCGHLHPELLCELIEIREQPQSQGKMCDGKYCISNGRFGSFGPPYVHQMQ